MKIETRIVGGKFVAIKIAIGDATHDLGLHDKEEAEQVAGILLSGSLEIQQAVDHIPNSQAQPRKASS
jgi:hypothetical protein